MRLPHVVCLRQTKLEDDKFSAADAVRPSLLHCEMAWRCSRKGCS